MRYIKNINSSSRLITFINAISFLSPLLNNKENNCIIDIAIKNIAYNIRELDLFKIARATPHINKPRNIRSLKKRF
jgi:hypothetical protein